MTKNESAREAWATLRELAHRRDVLDRAAAVAHEAGLTPSLGRALAQLSLEHPTPMRDLANTLRCDASYVTSVADGLEERGLVERTSHATDRRIKVLTLTPKGAELAARLRSEVAEPPAELLALSAHELDSLLEILHKLQH